MMVNPATKLVSTIFKYYAQDESFLFCFTATFCVFTDEVFKDIFGYNQIYLIGYVEKDGKEGLTSEDEKVYIGGSIEEGVVVSVGCSNWYVYMETFKVHSIYFELLIKCDKKCTKTKSQIKR